MGRGTQASNRYEAEGRDGPKQVSVKYLDNAGNWSETFSAAIVLDTIPPSVMAAPGGGLYNTPQSVTLTASEAAAIYYTTDGTTPSLASAPYSQPVSIPATATLSFFARDPAGNSSPVKSESYTIDTIPPVAKITSHANGQYINTTTITLSGTLDDQSAAVTVNGAPAQVTAGGFTLSGITLAEGENSLSVEAKDPAGNTSTDSITLHLDTAPPVVTVTSPQSNDFLKTLQITITGTVNEPVTSVTVNGMAATVSGQTFTLPVTLTEGPNALTIKAMDRAGNEGSVPLSVNLDTVAPVVTIAVPAAGLLTKTAQVTVAGTVSEENSVVTVNGQPATVSGLTFTATVTLAEGQNTINVTAVDRAGNSGTAAVTVNLDSTTPAAPVLATLKTPTNATEGTTEGTLLIS